MASSSSSGNTRATLVLVCPVVSSIRTFRGVDPCGSSPSMPPRRRPTRCKVDSCSML